MLESVPIMLALCSIFPRPYYARHYAGIIRPSLHQSAMLKAIYYSSNGNHTKAIIVVMEATLMPRAGSIMYYSPGMKFQYKCKQPHMINSYMHVWGSLRFAPISSGHDPRNCTWSDEVASDIRRCLCTVTIQLTLLSTKVKYMYTTKYKERFATS